ncbi:molybdenum cofactor guanylyltransferase [Desulfonatronovibrio magnus]|uniref:molybdenum cofactor guanylyltransferase n=1 Tax=Desulfonatronovibrio magnus TaxID=698827 RepID=UPI0005EB1F5A|nr:molybdenum cofactor guanylyltransferase [Desulfonatronovibrio magnus]RQD64524.1 MAG: molybdenum cofactor guanylyltransferase [Desulfonatronovibrio sp. MSAO_Bac4]
MNETVNTEIRAVVLAGGKSTRLGQDKTQLLVKGKPLLYNMLDLAAMVCSETYCVGREVPDSANNSGWMLDKIPGIGPMGGIITALQNLKAPCLILACDLPGMRQDILQRLIQKRCQRPGKHCMTTFYQKSTGYIEALVAIYEPESLDLLIDSYRNGCYKLSKAIPFDYRSHIEYGTREEKYFFNVNYPHDLRFLKGETIPEEH